MKLRGLKNKWKQIKKEIQKQTTDPNAYEIFIPFDFSYWNRTINKTSKEELVQILIHAAVEKKDKMTDKHRIVGKLDLTNLSDSVIFIFDIEEDQEEDYHYTKFFYRNFEELSWEVVEEISVPYYQAIVDANYSPIFVKSISRSEEKYMVFFGDVSREMFVSSSLIKSKNMK